MYQAPPATPSTYAKVSGCVGLYRHSVSGRYYAVKKVAGKAKERSLGTSDRKIAERRQAEWIADLGKVDAEVEKSTLQQLFHKYLAINQGKSRSTRGIIQGVLRDFVVWWPHGLDFQVRNVRPSHLDEWLATYERRVKNTTYNRYGGVLRQVFGLAVKDRIIAESPFLLVATPRKRPQKTIRRIPTVEQFEAIVDSVRAQRHGQFAEDAADFLAFEGLAGLGQAEASSLTWGDIDFEQGRLNIRRHKTDTRFIVPIYPHLRPLLEKLRTKAGTAGPAGVHVFRLVDPRKALSAACKRLGLPHFSQRNLRQFHIVRLLKAGVSVKLISKWQGHRDGGQLILDTYTEVIGSDDAEYERQQLAKIAI